MNYAPDERNPRLVVSIEYNDGSDNKSKKDMLVSFRKSAMADLFAAVEKIQDDLNAYM